MICCRTTLPEALVMLVGFGFWNLLVSGFFVKYSCNLNTCPVTRDFCLVSVRTMLNKDVEKYVPINLNGFSASLA